MGKETTRDLTSFPICWHEANDRGDPHNEWVLYKTAWLHGEAHFEGCGESQNRGFVRAGDGIQAERNRTPSLQLRTFESAKTPCQASSYILWSR